MIADAAGRAIAFRLAPGQAHELPQAMPLLERLPGVPRWIVADRGYTSHRFREHIWDLGARPAIPPQRHEAPVACPGWIYRNRHRVECGVPECGGALSREQEDALWQQVFTAQPARRREFEPSSKRRKRRPAVWPRATA